MNERDPDRRKEGEPPPLFDLTRWSIIRRARDESTVALNALFTQYRQPLLTHLRARGCGPDQAEDLVQGFCAHLLGRDFLANVAQGKGRFRTWLLNALQNYIRDEYAKQKTLKRGQGRVPASLDEAREDGTPLLDPAADTTPADREFDRAWAQSVLTNALNRLGRDCATTGHTALFQALEPVLFAEETSPSYREIAEQLAMTEGAVKVAAHRIRARLKGLIREEVLQTVANQKDWEEEVRYLISLFSR
jgi:RNA polymerase sigma-70 factor (ECF subfamily)